MQSQAAPCTTELFSRLQVVPGGGSISVFISFTPRVLPETVTEVQCEGFVLGFMSLDDEVN